MRERAFVADAREAKGLHDGSITRIVRMVEPAPPKHVKEWRWCRASAQWAPWLPNASGGTCGCYKEYARSPFGVVGDRLWVQEEWAACISYDSYDGRTLSPHAHDAAYLAGGGFDFSPGERGRWRSSTQMPRWATRTLLDVTDVRVVRAKAVSEEDAKVTGLLPLYGHGSDQPSFARAIRKLYGGDTWLWLGSVRGETKGD